MLRPMEGVTVRPARTAADWQAVRDLCCRTGSAGDPIEASRWPFFAKLWVGPYQRVVPAWTLVADRDGEVVGYLTGCPDSLAFRRARRRAFTPLLLLGVVAGRYGWSADTRRFLCRALGLAPGPEARLRRRLPATFERELPAHLHMNVAAGLRGQGVGRQLVDRHVETLRERGTPGVHLYCGSAARGFYERLGFAEVGQLEIRPGVRVHALGRRLAAPTP